MASEFPGLGLAAAVVVALALWAEAARAEPLNRLSADLSVSGNVTDNARSAPDSSPAKETDVYWIITPHVGLGRRLSFGTVSLDAGLTYYKFTNATELDRLFEIINAKLELPVTNRITVQLADDYHAEPIVYSNTNDTRTNLIQTNYAHGQIQYEIPLEGAWEGHLTARSDRENLLGGKNIFAGSRPDFTDVTGDGLVRRRLGRRSDLSLEGTASRFLFDQHPKAGANLYFSDYSLVAGVLTWSFHPQRSLTLSAGGGLGSIFFHSTSHMTGTGIGSLTWEPSARDRVDLKVQRSQSAQATGQVFDTTTFSLKVSHDATQRVSLILEGRITLLQSVTPAAKPPFFIPYYSQLYSVRPAVSYAMGKHFRTELAYQYAQLESNSASSNFRRNTVALTVVGTY